MISKTNFLGQDGSRSSFQLRFLSKRFFLLLLVLPILLLLTMQSSQNGLSLYYTLQKHTEAIQHVVLTPTLRNFRGFSSPSRQMLQPCCRICHGHFSPHHFWLIAHNHLTNLTVISYTQSVEKASLNTT